MPYLLYLTKATPTCGGRGLCVSVRGSHVTKTTEAEHAMETSLNSLAELLHLVREGQVEQVLFRLKPNDRSRLRLAATHVSPIPLQRLKDDLAVQRDREALGGVVYYRWDRPLLLFLLHLRRTRYEAYQALSRGLPRFKAELERRRLQRERTAYCSGCFGLVLDSELVTGECSDCLVDDD
jgi:hypothetical protein